MQGVKVLEDFNIAEKAGGAGRAIVQNFSTQVTDNTLEIHFYWAGKGTTAIPDRGFYGPLISAISIESKIIVFSILFWRFSGIQDLYIGMHNISNSLFIGFRDIIDINNI